MRSQSAAGLVLTAVMVAACGGSGVAPTSGVSPTADASTTTVVAPRTPSPAPAATYTVAAGPQGTNVLHAVNFGVPLSVTYAADWRIEFVGKNLVDLRRTDDSDLGISPLALVTLPGAHATDPYIPVPADFVAWIKGRPEFVALAPRTVTIGGRSGTLIDADFVWKDGNAKSEFLRYGDGGWLYDQYDAGNRARFIILPGPSGVGGVVIVMNAGGAVFPAAATSLDALLATLTFDPAP